jgi:hypothetical protein
MTEKRKREKVVAEITATHLTQFAHELGRRLNSDEAMAFLNQEGHAYAMWKEMMHAGEEYIKSALQKQPSTSFPLPRGSAARSGMAI